MFQDFRWGKLHYELFGNPYSGLPLLFLHGTGCQIDFFEPIIESCMRDRLAVIAIDFRGHGQSDACNSNFTIESLAEDAIALIQELNIKQIAVAGHSLGGMVAMKIAEKQPSLVSGLVLFEGWTELRSCSNSFGPGHMFGDLNSDRVEYIKELSSTTRNKFEPSIWLDFWQSVKLFSSYQFLRKTTIPIFEVYGDIDKLPFSGNNSLLIPPNSSIETIWLEGCGHYLILEDAPACYEVCKKLIDML